MELAVFTPPPHTHTQFNQNRVTHKVKSEFGEGKFAKCQGQNILGGGGKEANEMIPECLF